MNSTLTPESRIQRRPGARVEVETLVKRYTSGETAIVALDDVSFVAEPGQAIGVVGPSGSGKSTLLHLVGAMDVADRGRIQVADAEVTALSRREQVGYRRRIGFVFQRFHLLPALSALDNVVAPLLPYRTGFDKLERGRELLAAVGLAGREDSVPSRLSGGQSQRVAIARALVNEPILLLADEPTGNLDSATGAEIMELLLRLREERGMTLIVATHDPVIASRCDRILRLLDGRLTDDVTVPRTLEPEAMLERISRMDV
jgi:putative ABC transport system ATP-binding protein